MTTRGTKPTKPELPAAPDPTVDSKTEYAGKASAFAAALPGLSQFNSDTVAYVDAAATDAEAAALGIEAARDAALAAQGAAESAAGAAPWQPDTDYSAGQSVYSPLDFCTYRARANVNSPDDPATDDTNWVIVGVSAAPTLPRILQTRDITPVDVFVYDTSRDSDGGAWRHRCQHTSWFNEPLNTATRGARREFPAVAVIVAEAAKITIYDGDDPDLPMWRVLPRDTVSTDVGRAWWRSSAVVTAQAVAALNGKLFISLGFVVTASNTVCVADFAADDLLRYSNASAGSNRGLPITATGGDIVLPINFGSTIVASVVNDIAMTALPDAPVDPATGLPLLTIAVGTGGGLSVITDSGAVFDSAKTAAVSAVTIDAIGRVRAAYADGEVITYDPDEITADGFTGTTLSAASTPALLGATTKLARHASGSAQGLTFAHGSMVAYAAADYATGWMVGDTRGCWLADTVAGDLVGDAAYDRSVSDNGLSVVGTITRAPVAPGADLVAYSGFSAANYLEGTDAAYADTLYAMCWEQTNGVWGFKHGVVSAAPIDGLTITGTTLKVAGTKPKALLRVTSTTPTAAQLAKIEADERALFQENAPCTLCGSSDAVTALAHDVSTGLLHAGTTAGRSVFDGLSRVSNTTTPVSAAISAAGGLIVEG